MTVPGTAPEETTSGMANARISTHVGHMTTRTLNAALTAARIGLTLTALAACAGTAGGPSPANPVVMVDAGALEGRIDSTSGALAFNGIPYAAPPVGDLRWRAPQPVKRWDGVRDASRIGLNCMQHRPYGDIDAQARGTS